MNEISEWLLPRIFHSKIYEKINQKEIMQIVGKLLLGKYVVLSKALHTCTAEHVEINITTDRQKSL